MARMGSSIFDMTPPNGYTCVAGMLVSGTGQPATSTKVLYMSFDKFLLAVESRDLSQADKSIIRVSSFPKLSDG